MWNNVLFSCAQFDAVQNSFSAETIVFRQKSITIETFQADDESGPGTTPHIPPGLTVTMSEEWFIKAASK